MFNKSSLEKDHLAAKCQVTYAVTNISHSDALSSSGKPVIISIDRHSIATNSHGADSKSMNHMLLSKRGSHLRTLCVATSLGHKHHSLQLGKCGSWMLSESLNSPARPSIPGGDSMTPWPLMDILLTRPVSKPGDIWHGFGCWVRVSENTRVTP